MITGIFLASRLKAGTPTVGLDGGYDLESIAAVVLGGTALTGGRGGVIGTIGGVFILAVLDNVFNQLEFNSFLRDVVRGHHHHRGRRGLRATHGEEGMSTENVAASGFGAETGDRRSRFLSALASTGTIFVLLLILWVWITILNPTFAEPGPVPGLPEALGPARHPGRGRVLRAHQRQLRPVGRFAGDGDRSSSRRA